MSPLQPQPGSQWMHKSTGTVYEFICIARMEWNPAINLVIYKGDMDTWARPADEFLDGRFVEVEKAA